ncbi:MAG: hypothetical protein ABR603_17645 [Pyrinomonadaceae bacterium]
MVRVASTWSGPFCASSSSMRMSESRQTGLREMVSTRSPTAASFCATNCCGVRMRVSAPLVWSFGSQR